MWSSRVVRAADAVAVAALAVSGQVSVWTAQADKLEGGRLLHAGLIAVITLPLLVRRRWPFFVLLMVVGAATVQYQLGGELFQPWFAMLLTVYSVAAHAELRLAAAGAAVAAILLLSVDVPRLLAGDPVDEVVPAWVFTAGVWAFGRWVRHRRSDAAVLRARAENAERQREEQAALAVSEERARIARELHDLVAHSMGVIVIQSQAGQRSLHADAGTAGGALSAIETTARQGLGEMRRMLGLLTDTGDSGASPQPSLTDLDELVGHVRSTGLHVELLVEGDVSTLPAGVDLAAYRIVQEALTNVLKHSAASTARVVVTYVGSCVEVEIIDDGRGASPTTEPGRGLIGMRERAALYGGAVEAHGLPGGGFRVWARLAVGAGAR